MFLRSVPTVFQRPSNAASQIFPHHTTQHQDPHAPSASRTTGQRPAAAHLAPLRTRCSTIVSHGSRGSLRYFPKRHIPRVLQAIQIRNSPTPQPFRLPASRCFSIPTLQRRNCLAAHPRTTLPRIAFLTPRAHYHVPRQRAVTSTTLARPSRATPLMMAISARSLPTAFPAPPPPVPLRCTHAHGPPLTPLRPFLLHCPTPRSTPALLRAHPS